MFLLSERPVPAGRAVHFRTERRFYPQPTPCCHDAINVLTFHKLYKIDKFHRVRFSRKAWCNCWSRPACAQLPNKPGDVLWITFTCETAVNGCGQIPTSIHVLSHTCPPTPQSFSDLKNSALSVAYISFPQKGETLTRRFNQQALFRKEPLKRLRRGKSAFPGRSSLTRSEGVLRIAPLFLWFQTKRTAPRQPDQ